MPTLFDVRTYGNRLLSMSPKRSLGDMLCLLRFLLLHHPDCCRVMYCYSIIILILIILLPHIFVRRFLGDALIKLYETLQEYHIPCEVVLLRVDFFQNGCRCHGNGKNAKILKKNKNDDSRLLAEQKLMKLDRNNIHIQWNEISQKKSESVGQILPQLAWKQKRGDFFYFLFL